MEDLGDLIFFIAQRRLAMRTILTVAAALLATTAAIAQDKASQKFIIEAI